MTTTERRVEVKLLGELGRRFGRSYVFYVKNAREVISALSHQVEGFKEYLYTAHEKAMGFKLISDDPEGMDYEEVLMSCDRLIIAPIIAGSGGGAGRILLGAALIGLAFVPGVGAVAAGTKLAASGAAVGSLTTIGSLMFSLGASLVLGGIASLIAPPVQPPSGDSKKRDSFMFDRAAELTTQGYPIPLLYGRFLCQAPLVVSSAISTEQLSA